MRIIKAEFRVSSRYVNTEYKETIQFEFEEDSTEYEIEKEIQEVFEQWVWENIDASYEIE